MDLQNETKMFHLDTDSDAYQVSDVTSTAPHLSEEHKRNLRIRRTKSVTRAEEIKTETEKIRKSQPDKP